MGVKAESIPPRAKSGRPLPWLLIFEIFPIRLRGRAVSLTTAFLWLTVFAGAQLFASLDDCFLGRKTRIGGRCVLVLYCRVSLRISLRLADVARDEGQDTRRGGHKVESELCTAAACVRPQSGQIRPKNVGGMLARTPSFSSVPSPTSPPFTLCPPWLHAPRRDFFPCFFGRRNAGAGQMVATAFR